MARLFAAPTAAVGRSWEEEDAVGRSAEPARLLPLAAVAAVAALLLAAPAALLLPLALFISLLELASLSPTPTRLLLPLPLRNEVGAVLVPVLPRRESLGAVEEAADVLRAPLFPVAPPGRRAGRFWATAVVAAAGFTRWLRSSTLPQFDRVSLSGLVPSGLVVHAVTEPVRDMVAAKSSKSFEANNQKPARSGGAQFVEPPGTCTCRLRSARPLTSLLCALCFVGPPHCCLSLLR